MTETTTKGQTQIEAMSLEVSVMKRIQRALDSLPDEKSRHRVLHYMLSLCDFPQELPKEQK